VQDELAHAHIEYRLLGDLGVDMNALIYEREPLAFKYPYAFEAPLDSWHEMVMANGLYDRAGFTITGPEGVACDGQVTACLPAADSGRPTPWPSDIAELLTAAGRQGDA
jgi:1,2-phenylacetyl-CoA epoxidase catalytic subunit